MTIELNKLHSKPLVSIVVPSFNQGQFIRATIDSILSQDYRPLEIHVIDGGSKDATLDVLNSYGIMSELNWTSESDRGVVDAVNKGFARVSGQIIGIQSSDDVYLPGAFSRIVAEFERDRELGLVYGDTVKVDAEGKEIRKSRIGPFSLENMFLMRTWIPQPSAFFRPELLDVCGCWDERVPYAADTDLWLRMAFRTKVVKIDQFLSQRRIHDAQRDAQAAKIARDFCRMIDQSADIATSPEGLRSKAKAAKHLIKVRYNPTDSDWYAAWHMWRAGCVCPERADWRSVRRLLAMPTRRWLSRVKQRLLRRTAVSVNPNI